MKIINIQKMRKQLILKATYKGSTNFLTVPSLTLPASKFSYQLLTF